MSLNYLAACCIKTTIHSLTVDVIGLLFHLINWLTVLAGYSLQVAILFKHKMLHRLLTILMAAVLASNSQEHLQVYHGL